MIVIKFGSDFQKASFFKMISNNVSVKQQKQSNTVNFIKKTKQEITKIDGNIVQNYKNVVTEKTYESRTAERSGKLNTLRRNYNNYSFNSVEDLLCRISPHKSFLYKEDQSDKPRPYVPMAVGSPRLDNNIKTKRFRTKSDVYTYFEVDRTKNTSDGGYYLMQANSKADNKPNDNTYCGYDLISTPKSMRKSFLGKVTADAKIKNLDTIEPVVDHFYEDLPAEENDKKTSRGISFRRPFPLSKSPCIMKLNEIFHSFKIRNRQSASTSNSEDEVKKNQSKVKVVEENEKKYMEVLGNADEKIYDTIGAKNPKPLSLEVEDYLEPIRCKDYADVVFKEKDDSFIHMIMRIFEGLSFHKDSNQETKQQTEETKDAISSKPPPERPETAQKWNEKEVNMADRPLPVPVENEFYYLNVDRLEAERLLEGQPDGTFILRPSSQPFHAYTISIAYKSKVHNVGVRRRSDSRLALGYTKQNEKSFVTIRDLIEHHYQERLMLIAEGQKIGSTQLKKLEDRLK